MVGSPEVRAIQLLRCRPTLILGPELTLIDCGYAAAGRRIGRAIQRHGREVSTSCVGSSSPTDTPDHAGSASALAAMGATILIHPADGENLRTTWRGGSRAPHAAGSSRR